MFGLILGSICLVYTRLYMFGLILGSICLV